MSFTTSPRPRIASVYRIEASPGRKLASGNRLLNALEREDFERLLPHLERGHMELYHVLAKPGHACTHIYFPESCVVSLVNRMRDGTGVEAGSIGNEGMAGLPAYLDASPSESETFCQVAGMSLRGSVQAVLEAASERPEMKKLFNRYVSAYLSQLSQSVACNRLHTIDQRCARWLLMTHDRVGDVESFPLKHEFLALMLGVRRAGVTGAAGLLQAHGFIRYRRGIVRVTDRKGLEGASCECYDVVRAQLAKLLPLTA